MVPRRAIGVLEPTSPTPPLDMPRHPRLNRSTPATSGRSLRLEPLEDRRVLSVTLEMLTDASRNDGVDSNPHSFTSVGDQTYFVAKSRNDAKELGVELWRTNGTSAGTQLVADLTPGWESSTPRFLTNVNGVLFFAADAPSGPGNLWKTDGTAAGTLRVTTADGLPVYAHSEFVSMSDAYYFAGSATYGDVELWRTDGTAAGTWQVKDIRVGSSGSIAISALGSTTNLPPKFHVMNDEIYFVANDGAAGSELWKSNGTPEGTVLVKDLAPGAGSGMEQRYGTPFAHLDGILFFPGMSGADGIELWRSDGSAAGTYRVKDIFPGQIGSSPNQLIAFEDSIFFVAYDDAYGRELWKTDGTDVGTTVVYNSSGNSNVNDLTVFDGILYFSAAKPGGYTLYRIAGQEVSPERLMLPGSTFNSMTVPQPSTSQRAQAFNNLTVVGNTLFFSAGDASGDFTLWKLTETETVPSIVFTGSLASPKNPRAFTDVNGTLFFAAGFSSQITPDLEPWRSDGTQAGTNIIKDLSGQNWPSGIGAVLDVNGRLFFAKEGNLWISDATAATTQKVAPLAADSSNVKAIGQANGVYFFFAGDGLWRSDGTTAGTYKIKSMAAGSRAYQLDYAELDGILYFGAGGANNYELWRSDGTAAGTYVVSDLNSSGGLNSGFPLQITRLGKYVYFSISNGAARGLWRSDGTATGTILVKEFAGGGPHYILQGGDSLYFAASDGFSGFVLWKSDGTTEGTFPLTANRFDAYISSPGSYPNYSQLAYVNDQVFFTSYSSLWRSDGTTAGTFLIKEIRPGSAFGPGGHPMLFAAESSIYFVANDGTHGFELWKSDGTPEGTAMVADLGLGESSGMFSSNGWVDAATVGDIFYFSRPYSSELWASDGTAEGTKVAAEIYPGSLGSDPRSLTNANGRLYFGANDGTHGTELWVLSPDPAAMAAGDYDQNGVTDGADFLKWQRAFGSRDATNDGDGDGLVGLGDLEAWKQGFGAGDSSALAQQNVVAVAAIIAAEEEVVASAPSAAREERARDALFAAGDFSRLFALGNEGEAEHLLRRRRGVGGRR